ncbi:hypothetical protein [Priestia megaterium]|uniref:hypothetical protein n=1 Tax=Priestia megaterium TaxID=1404 RepID=UPI000B32A255|nr:hypothetical protein [Priestia megaterium]
MKIKKAVAGLSFVALMAVGGTVFAASPTVHKTMNEEDCMTMSKKDCMEMMKNMSKEDCMEMMKGMSKKDCMKMMKDMKK